MCGLHAGRVCLSSLLYGKIGLCVKLKSSNILTVPCHQGHFKDVCSSQQTRNWPSPYWWSQQACECRSPERPEEGIGLPGARVTGSCKTLGMVVGNKLRFSEKVLNYWAINPQSFLKDYIKLMFSNSKLLWFPSSLSLLHMDTLVNFNWLHPEHLDVKLMTYYFWIIKPEDSCF